ncbi:MAG: porin, partial [Thauera sp.]
AFGQGNDNSGGEVPNTGPGQKSPSGNEIAAFYSGGPVNAAASYRDNQLLSGPRVKDYYLAGNVAFGAMKVYVLLGGAQSNEPTRSVDEAYTNIGLGFKLGETDLNLQYGMAKDKAAAASANTSTLMAVSVFHPLAKNIHAYAQFGSLRNDANVSRQPYIGSGSMPTAPAGTTVSGAIVGMRYVF